MARPAEQLLQEHAFARRALRVLERIADHVENGLPFPATDVASLLRLFSGWVEAVHHRKENEFVLPALALLGAESTATAAGRLAAEQEVSRGLLHALMMFWEPDDHLLDSERTGFTDTARTYASRLRRHMELEEEEVLPALHRTVPPDDQLAMVEQFAELDGERGSMERWRAELDRLEVSWCPV